MINKEKILKEYQDLYPELLQSLAEIISIPSVLDVAQEKKPFGQNVDQCLDLSLEICKNLGMRVFKDPEGYYGYAEVGEGALIGILCHLDVVSVHNPEEWDDNPFTLTQKNDKLIARGVSDDKAPTVVSIYAVKALMNLGVKFNKRIRLIFGTDEENLWRCMTEYRKKEEIPTQGFTPDGDFPVIFAEKGLLQFHLYGELSQNFSIKYNGSWNAVPAFVEYQGNNYEELKTELQRQQFEFQENTEKKIITVIGKAVHAQCTENGINPIARLALCLKNIGVKHSVIEFIAEKCQSPFGKGLFGQIEDEETGLLKTNLAKINLDSKNSQISFDFRIPVTIKIEDLIEKIKNIMQQYKLEFELYDKISALYVDKNSEFVKTLCKIYYEETGFDATPITTGGATYSRMFENFVTFGMGFPDSEKTAHMTNESLLIKDIDRAFIIYTKAILYLLNT